MRVEEHTASYSCHRQIMRFDYMHDRCSKLFKIMPHTQDRLLSKFICPHKKQVAQKFLHKVPKHVKSECLLSFTKMTIHVSPLMIVRFEKFVIGHIQESKPVLQDELDPIFVRPDVLLSTLDGRTGIIWNTVI